MTYGKHCSFQFKKLSKYLSTVESYLENVPKTERFETKRRRKALLCVFKYLNHKTLARVALVCREWKAISRSPSLWINVELKFGQISSKVSLIFKVSLLISSVHKRSSHTDIPSPQL